MANELEDNTQAEIQGATTEIDVQPGDTVVVTLTKEESDLIQEVRDIKAGKHKKNEEDTVLTEIDNTLSLSVPAIDGTTAIISIPADAEDIPGSIEVAVSEDTVADILTLVGDKGESK